MLANDYSFLLILGVMMAVISFGLDYVIEKFQMGMFVAQSVAFIITNYKFAVHYNISIFLLAQILLYNTVHFSVVLQYLLWVGFPLLLITFSVGFVHLVSPHAIGILVKRWQ